MPTDLRRLLGWGSFRKKWLKPIVSAVFGSLGTIVYDAATGT